MTGKFKSLFLIAILAVVILGGGVGAKHFIKNGKTPDSTGTATTESTSTKKDTDESTTEESTKEEISTEEGGQISTENQAEIKHEGTTKEDPEDEIDNSRYSNAEDELFNVTLRFFDEYNMDSDFFKVNKALAAQDNTHDYLYFQYTYKDKTAFTCYDYDGKYFREESQETFEKEFNTDLKISKKKNKDNVDGMNIYYNFTKANIKHVNAMY